MPRIDLPIPIFIPQRLYEILRDLKNKSKASSSTINLLGDRDIEWSWIASEIPDSGGEALDFGPGGSSLGLVAAMRGFKVLSIDIGPVYRHYIHPDLSLIQADILRSNNLDMQFDLMLNCSTVEHVGLTGRYGTVQGNADGDVEAMQILRNLLKVEKGIMLLTIPVGKDAVFSPLTRIYGSIRLPKLLKGFEIQKENFWVKNRENKWIQTDRKTALEFDASVRSWNALKNRYALGCFVLSRSS